MKDRSTVKWLIRESKKEHKNIIFLMLLDVVFSGVAVFFAFVMEKIIDSVTVYHDYTQLWIWTAVIVFCILLQFCLRILINGLTEKVRAKLEIELKTKTFERIIRKEYRKINQYHSGELMNRLTSDVTVVSDGIISIVPGIVSALTRLVFAVVALIILNWIFAVIFLCAGILVSIIVTATRNKLKNLHKDIQSTDGRTRSFMQETIENLLAVKVFSTNDKMKQKAENLQHENFIAKMRHRDYAVFGNAAYNLVFSAGYMFALVYGAFCILKYPGTMTYGSLTAILQLVGNVQVPFASLSSLVPKYFSMLSSAERIIEIERIPEERIPNNFDRDLEYKKLEKIDIKDLTFAYDKDLVLDKANLTINKGDFIDITGTSGIGKSTLLKLVLGIYSNYSGSITYVAEGKEKRLDNTTRKLFSYVPQQNLIFSGTIEENIKFVNDKATDEEVKKALEIVDIDKFIETLPNKLQTTIGERGLGLSEGQVQRIAIARAIISKAPIMLLDEATSALDEKTEETVLKNLKENKDITLIIISHRPCAKKVCERVIEIVNKEIVEYKDTLSTKEK